MFELGDQMLSTLAAKKRKRNKRKKHQTESREVEAPALGKCETDGLA
jgi:hypothetical protein